MSDRAGELRCSSCGCDVECCAFCDEVDEWPADLDHQGDPMAMVDARQKAFHDTADYKKFVGSTPTVKKYSRIDRLEAHPAKRLSGKSLTQKQTRPGVYAGSPATTTNVG